MHRSNPIWVYVVVCIITPPEVTDTGPGVNRGSGGAPGGVALKNGWVYMRVQGGFISYSLALSVCVSQNGGLLFKK